MALLMFARPAGVFTATASLAGGISPCFVSAASLSEIFGLRNALPDGSFQLIFGDDLQQSHRWPPLPLPRRLRNIGTNQRVRQHACP